MATRTRTPEREQFLRDVLTTAIEGGIQYWAIVSAYDPEAGTATVAAYDDDERHEPYNVTIDTIAHGIGVARRKRLGSSSGPDYVKQFWRADRTNGEDGDYDAEIADQLVQFGIFGEGVYG